jgi:dephospho-CoA kinase
MKIVGIAGESGTGKSTVAAHLMMRGGGYIDADIVGHDALVHDVSVRSEIRGRFGDKVFGADGRVDRRRLGSIVFRDEGQRLALNEIIHPVISKVCQERVEELRSAGVPFVVVDAALLLEADMGIAWDLLIALECDEEVQFERLMAKGGRTEQEVRDRLRSQRGIMDRFDKADVVVDTYRPKDEVLAEIDGLIDDLLDQNEKEGKIE